MNSINIYFQKLSRQTVFFRIYQWIRDRAFGSLVVCECSADARITLGLEIEVLPRFLILRVGRWTVEPGSGARFPAQGYSTVPSPGPTKTVYLLCICFTIKVYVILVHESPVYLLQLLVYSFSSSVSSVQFTFSCL